MRRTPLQPIYGSNSHTKFSSIIFEGVISMVNMESFFTSDIFPENTKKNKRVYQFFSAFSVFFFIEHQQRNFRSCRPPHPSSSAQCQPPSFAFLFVTRNLLHLVHSNSTELR